MQEGLDLLVDVEPRIVGDAVAAVLAHELVGAVVHRTATHSAVGRYAAAVVQRGERLRAKADLVIRLPSVDDPNGQVEVQRGDDVLAVSIEGDVVAWLLRILRSELDA